MINHPSIKRSTAFFAITLISVASLFIFSPKAHAFVGDECDPTPSRPVLFLGLPRWYEYLEGKYDDENRCIPQLSTKQDGSIDLSSIWLIGLAVIEILLRVAGIIAIFMIILAGFRYMTSQGNPENTKAARNTIQNAMIGMAIAIFASVTVGFVARLLLR